MAETEKICPKCGKKSTLPSASQTCPKCGEVAWPRTPKGEKKAKSGKVMSLPQLLAEVKSRTEAIKEWGNQFKTWDEAKTAVEGVFAVANACGGEEALLEAIDYLAEEEE
jgi:predicted RNA-binding Zn-ribbon protein involved in translation (DUF1610 family)